MVFLGRQHFAVEHQELLGAARRQANTFSWDELITVCDEPSEAVAFIVQHDPDEHGSGVQRRRPPGPQMSPRVSGAMVETALFPEAFARIRAEFGVPADFPAAVEAEATTVARRGPVVPPGAAATARLDARDVPLVTIDPPGSQDLDQAFHAERRSGGFRVRYATAGGGLMSGASRWRARRWRSPG